MAVARSSALTVNVALSATGWLEFHHDEPSLGGDRSADNIRLTRRAHNAYMAEMDYGKPRWTNTASANLSLRTESLKPRPRALLD